MPAAEKSRTRRVLQVSLLDRLQATEQAGEQDTPSLAQARDHCRQIARDVFPPMPALTPLLSSRQLDDLSALLAFCAWSHDLDTRAKTSAPKRLDRWRKELQRCQSAGSAGAAAPAPTHPVFITLATLVKRRLATMGDLHHLLDCFELEHRAPRIDTWAELRERTHMFVRPLSRIALRRENVHRERSADRDNRAMMELLLSAHLITWRWMRVRRDVESGSRCPLPVQDSGFDAADLKSMIREQDEPQARVAFIRAMRPLVSRTRSMNKEARPLLRAARADLKPALTFIWLHTATSLDAIERIGCATLFETPDLSDKALRRITAAARPSRIFSARRDR